MTDAKAFFSSLQKRLEKGGSIRVDLQVFSVETRRKSLFEGAIRVGALADVFLPVPLLACSSETRYTLTIRAPSRLRLDTAKEIANLLDAHLEAKQTRVTFSGRLADLNLQRSQQLADILTQPNATRKK